MGAKAFWKSSPSLLLRDVRHLLSRWKDSGGTKGGTEVWRRSIFPSGPIRETISASDDNRRVDNQDLIRCQ